jgi:hypothetical protein
MFARRNPGVSCSELLSATVQQNKNMLTKTQLEEIRLRADGATPGPWHSHMQGGGKGGPNKYCITDKSEWGFKAGEYYYIGEMRPPSPSKAGYAGANAKFVAHAREDVPALLTALDIIVKICRSTKHQNQIADILRECGETEST